MSNLRICAKNHVDDPRCVLSCALVGSPSSLVATLPLANLQTFIRGRIARLGCTSPFVLRGTYGGDSVRASLVAMIRHNGEPDGTFRYQGYSDAAWTTLVQDSGTLPMVDSATLGYLDFGIAPLGSSLWDSFYGQKIAQAWADAWSINTSQVIASWQLTISDPTNTTGYFDLSRLWIAKYFEFTYNPVYGSKIGWKESSQQWETDGGSIRVDSGVPYRQLSIDLQHFPEADRLELMDILRYCGMRKDLFLSLIPDGTGEEKRDFSMDALIQTMPDLTLVESDQHSTNIVFREA